MARTTRGAGRAQTQWPGAVSIVEPDRDSREQIAAICGAEGFNLFNFESAEKLLAAPPSGPACVLLGLRLPGMSGVDFMREMNRRGVGGSYIVISGCDEVASATDCLRLGVMDIAQQPWQPDQLRQKVHAAVAEDARRRELQNRYATLADVDKRLSPRERRVLEMLLAGALNKQIARKIEVSERTIEVDRSRVMRKFDAPNLAALAAKATELRLLTDYYVRVDPPLARPRGPIRATREDNP